MCTGLTDLLPVGNTKCLECVCARGLTDLLPMGNTKWVLKNVFGGRVYVRGVD